MGCLAYLVSSVTVPVVAPDLAYIDDRGVERRQQRSRRSHAGRAVVKDEVTRAGFRVQAEGVFLRNPTDERDWNASPEAAEAAGRRGTSDRFALRFIRPLTAAPTWHP